MRNGYETAGVASVAPSSPLISALARLDDSSVELENVVDSLFKRLDLVLTAPVPTPPGSNGSAEKVQDAAVLMRIAVTTERLQSIRNVVNQLHNRLVV